MERRKNYPRLTEKIFRQINSLVISLAKTLLSRNFYQKCVRTQCGKNEISLSLKKIREINCFSNFFSKTVGFTKFLSKSCEREGTSIISTLWRVNLRNLHTVNSYFHISMSNSMITGKIQIKLKVHS